MVPGPVLSELGPVALLVPSDLGPAVQDALLTVQTLLAGGHLPERRSLVD